MWLAALNVAAFLNQVADLVRGNCLFALRADIQGRGDQRVVAPPMSLS